MFTALSTISLDKIEKAGGPSSDDPYWARDREAISLVPVPVDTLEVVCLELVHYFELLGNL